METPVRSNENDGLVCSLCRYPGSDLRLLGCGCTIHARCAPMSLVFDVQGKDRHDHGAFPPPNRSKSMVCPVCRSGTVSGLYMMPLCFHSLERAVELRKTTATAEAKAVVSASSGNRKKHPRDDAAEIHAEASYLLLSSSSRSSMSSSGLSDWEQQRTGRWTDEEIAFVDYLVSAFDQGALPVPHGVKLNEFLGDMLICKSSRLTKKMKNAKLSSRSFVLCGPPAQTSSSECVVLSGLQEKFLMSVPAEPTQLELRFNLTKQWRTHFANLCVQIGYPFLDGKDWVASLEEMERRASAAEDAIRKVRRRRMGLALQTDGGVSANPSVFIGGIKADGAASQLQPILSTEAPSSSADPVTQQQTSSARQITAGGTERQMPDDDEFSMLDFATTDNGSTAPRGRQRTFSEEFLRSSRPRSFSEDFNDVLDDLMEPEMSVDESKIKPQGLTESTPASRRSSCGPFLDAIVMHLENNNLPFQHADVWVPSFLPRDTSGPSKAVDFEQLRLFHAGHATRGDLNDTVAHSLHEFGVYSDNFTFEPGHGLPGRVYSMGKSMWENSIHETDPKIFERAGGARIYGLKTAVGIPLKTPLVGRIVVALYSTENVPENIPLVQECARALAQYSPEPKWKLVIEMDDRGISPKISEGTKVPYMQNGIEHHSAAPPVSRQPPLPPPPQAARQMSSLPGVFPSQVVGCTSPTATTEARGDMEEQRIVSLMGEHMPISDNSAGESSSSSGSTSNLLPHFMSIRLLLLRPSSRRSPQENEMIDVLKSSFRAYSKDNRRTGAVLANLLAKDWICLQSTFTGAAAINNPLEPKPLESMRRPSTGSSSNTSGHGRSDQPRMPMSKYAPPPTAGPMNPPSQLVSRNSTINPIGFSNSTGMGSLNAHQANMTRNSSTDMNSLRRGSFEQRVPSPARRMSLESIASLQHCPSLDDNPQRTVQPQSVKSSAPETAAPQPLAAKPNVVLEH